MDNMYSRLCYNRLHWYHVPSTVTWFNNGQPKMHSTTLLCILTEKEVIKSNETTCLVFFHKCTKAPHITTNYNLVSMIAAVASSKQRWSVYNVKWNLHFHHLCHSFHHGFPLGVLRNTILWLLAPEICCRHLLTLRWFPQDADIQLHCYSIFFALLLRLHAHWSMSSVKLG